QSWYTGAQPTGIAHDQIDHHPRLACPIQRTSDVAVLQRIRLELDGGRSTAARVLDLSIDLLQQRAFQVVRGNEDLAIALRRGIPGEEVEQFREISAECLIGADETDVGIEPRGTRMIV